VNDPPIAFDEELLAEDGYQHGSESPFPYPSKFCNSVVSTLIKTPKSQI